MKPEDVLPLFRNNQSSLARALGCKPQRVCEWVEFGEIPDGRQYQLEVMTKGRLKADIPALRSKADAPVK